MKKKNGVKGVLGIKEGPIIIINPGSGPVRGTSVKHAIENIKQFVIDCAPGCKDIKWIRTPKEDYKNGRYAFLLWNDRTCHEIQMPGLPLERVRFMKDEAQNIWDFPRLYVDGSSWVWFYAILSNPVEWERKGDE